MPDPSRVYNALLKLHGSEGATAAALAEAAAAICDKPTPSAVSTAAAALRDPSTGRAA